MFLDIFSFQPDKYCVPAPTKNVSKVGTILVDKLPDKLSVVKRTGQLFKMSETKTGTLSWDQVDKKSEYGGRSADISKQDKIELSRRCLDIRKATELKPLWAQNYSRAEASNVKKGQRGYSQSTIGKYFSAFSAALSPEGGEG